MERRIVIYENNEMGHGEAVFTFIQHVSEQNNILERDLAKFVIEASKSQRLYLRHAKRINPMLVTKFIIKGLNKWNSIFEAINYLFSSDDFKPVIAPLPAHVEEKKLSRDTTKKDLETLRV